MVSGGRVCIHKMTLAPGVDNIAFAGLYKLWPGVHDERGK
jgi:hypothetical protein